MTKQNLWWMSGISKVVTGAGSQDSRARSSVKAIEDATVKIANGSAAMVDPNVK
jgi:hypothetical protein